MPSITTIKAELTQIIDAIESRKGAMEALLNSLRDTLSRLENLPPDAAEWLWEAPNLVATRTPNSFQERMAESTRRSLDQNYAERRKRNTQFNRIANFFVHRRNEPATVALLAGAIGASRSATTNILYRTQKEAFVSERVSGHSRLRAWKLRPNLYFEHAVAQGVLSADSIPDA